MRQKKLRGMAGAFALMMVLSLSLCLFSSFTSYAMEYDDSDPDDYITTNYNVDVVFDESHTAHITEEIAVDFIQEHHGIVRNIPMASDYTYEISDISVEGYEYSVSDEGNNKVVQIGDGDVYLTGKQVFVIKYQINYYLDNDSNADYLAQNMLPTEWATSIRDVQLRLTMPTDIDWATMMVYAGQYGESDTSLFNENFTAEYENGDKTLVLTGWNLPKGYGLTLRDTDLPDGYWSQAKSVGDAHKAGVMVVTVTSAVLGILSLLLWVLFGRDEKIIETVEFYPPEGMTPAEVGYAIDEELSDEEMMSSIIYLADKGYLTIEKKDKKSFDFIKVKDIDDDVPEFLQDFFNGLFKKKNHVNTKKVPTSFSKTLLNSKEKAKGYYESKYGEVFDSGSSLARYACVLLMAIGAAVFGITMEGQFDGIYLIVVPVILMAVGMFFAWAGFDNFMVKHGKGIRNIIIGTLLYLGGAGIMTFFYTEFPVKTHMHVFVVSEMAIFFFSIIMQRRSKRGTELMGKLKGFRTFIKTAEYDRLVQLCDENPQYFYNILPYAAVLGLETQWTRQFEKIKVPQPEWYDGGVEPFIYSSAWCHDMMKTCTKSAIPVSSSGSSGGFSGGHSGGGFSGGGGGGGGGGAW